MSGIEARGQESTVGLRQREQHQERTLAGAAVISQVQVVMRQETAAQRVAVRERRERRELAHEVTGKERQAVLPWIEAERREQIGRVQAAEKRIERPALFKDWGAQGEVTGPGTGAARAPGPEFGGNARVGARAFSGLQQLKTHSSHLVQSVVDHARTWGRPTFS